MNLRERNAAAKAAGALANPVRIAIIELLMKGPKLAGDIARELSMEPAGISRHLAVLKESGVLDCCPQWRCRKYALKSRTLAETVLGSLLGLGGEGDEPCES